MKPIKTLIVFQSILLSVIIDDGIVIMLIPPILTLLLHLMCHVHHIGDEMGCRHQYGCR